MSYVHYHADQPDYMGGPEVTRRCVHEQFDYESITKCPNLEPRDRGWIKLVEGLVDQQTMPDEWWKKEVLVMLGIPISG
jgi:hypothetical protein